jgi:hypothetical protein
MFDKRACHAALESAGMPVPPALATVGDFEELLQAMDERGWTRVFIKPAYGSSASGVVAFARRGNEMVAYSSVETLRSEGELKLYNSLRVRRYEDGEEIRRIVNTLCRDRVHVEIWIPKASIRGESFDLRVVVNGGRASHTVARLSSGPITNLHLGNKRGPVLEVRHRLGLAKWMEAMNSCERAMQVVPNTCYAGIDLAIAAGFQNHAILEMNAFGDLLPNVLEGNLDTYAAEVAGFCGIPQTLAA